MNFSQCRPGELAGLAPQALFRLFLAGNATFDSDVETRIRNNDLAGIIAQFDTSTTFHSNAFLTSAGLCDQVIQKVLQATFVPSDLTPTTR